MKQRYKISYERNEKIREVVRLEQDAVSAVEKLCHQYKWSFRVSLIDADTWGDDWALCYADDFGGINYNVRIVSMKMSN